VIGQYDKLNGYSEIKTKINGFEKLKILYDTNPPRQPTIQEKISRLSNQTSNRNFDLLYRNKYESKFSKYKYFSKV
jgi:hypothetical protein